MKLESNGNIISLSNATKIDAQVKEESEINTPDEFQEFQDDEAEVALMVEQNAEKVVAGKKKGTRKKRSLNWEEAERGLLLEVVKPKVDYVENRMVDTKSIKAKRLSWMQITKHFNALNFRQRSLEQIQVQWRSMKNSAKREYQQKHAKSTAVDGMELIEFMEELLKEPVIARSQTRGGGAMSNKKELLEIDDEDMPLAELPNSTNASEDTLHTSIIELPMSAESPSAAEESHCEIPQATPTRGRKKPGPVPNAQKLQATVPAVGIAGKIKAKRQRNSMIHEQTDGSDAVATVTNVATDVAPVQQQSELLPLLANALNNVTLPSINCPATNGVNATTTSYASSDEKYKKQLFDLMKRARLAEMDYTRREHEQKLRFEQMELDLKLNYYRQQEELKLRQMRDEHEIHMRHFQAEHEERMRVYAHKQSRNSHLQSDNSDNAAAH